MYLQKVKNKKNLEVTDEKSRVRIRIRSRGYESANPDPYQNATDPQHCIYQLWTHNKRVTVRVDNTKPAKKNLEKPT
jgi:hypothetical protein